MTEDHAASGIRKAAPRLLPFLCLCYAERIWHVAVLLFAAAVAFAWSAGAGPLPLVMLALSIATLGIYAAVGTFWALPSSILTGTGAAAGLALINSIGNCGGFAGPIIVGRLKGATGTSPWRSRSWPAPSPWPARWRCASATASVAACATRT
ncbi:MAG: hypothetical protein WB662_06150 [Methyloceanibacter sp.]